MPGPARLGTLIEALLDRRGWRTRYRRQLALELWPECVGPEIARHSAAAGWQGETLVIEVDHALWAQELSFLRAELCRRLNARLGARVVTDLRFRVAPARRARRARGAEGEALVPGPGETRDAGVAPAGREAAAAAEPATGPAAGGSLAPASASATALAAVADAELRARIARCLHALATRRERCAECGGPLEPVPPRVTDRAGGPRCPALPAGVATRRTPRPPARPARG